MKPLIDKQKDFNEFFDDLFSDKAYTVYEFSQTDKIIDTVNEHKKIKLINKGDIKDA